MDEWFDHIRRIATEVSMGRQFKGTLVVTSYDPKTHSVKGIIVPHGIETGQIPIGTPMTSGGSGAGTFIGPTPGSATDLDGTRMDVHFDLGDPNTLMATHKMSQPQNPPEVQSGEHLTQDEKGSTHLFKQDGSVTFTHYSKKGTQTWDKDGHLSVDTKGQNITIASGEGAQTFTAKSQSFTATNISIKGAVAVDGDITQNGSHTASGTLAGASGVTSSGHPVQTA